MPKACSPDAEDQIFEMQVRICKAFANSTRLCMLDLLAKQEHTASDLQGLLGITLPNVSQQSLHLEGSRCGKHPPGWQTDLLFVDASGSEASLPTDPGCRFGTGSKQLV